MRDEESLPYQPCPCFVLHHHRPGLAMSESSGRSSLIGVAISLIGNILISLALNCQKLAHVRLEKESEEEGEESAQRGVGNDEERQTLLSTTERPDGYGSQSGSNAALKANGLTGHQSGVDEEQQEHNDSMSTEFLRSRLWWLGISLMTLGEFGNFLCEFVRSNAIEVIIELTLQTPFVSVWICSRLPRCSFRRSCSARKRHFFTPHTQRAILSIRHWWYSVSYRRSCYSRL